MNNAIVYRIYEYLVVYHRKIMLKIFFKTNIRNSPPIAVLTYAANLQENTHFEV